MGWGVSASLQSGQSSLRSLKYNIIYRDLGQNIQTDCFFRFSPLLGARRIWIFVPIFFGLETAVIYANRQVLSINWSSEGQKRDLRYMPIFTLYRRRGWLRHCGCLRHLIWAPLIQLCSQEKLVTLKLANSPMFFTDVLSSWKRYFENFGPVFPCSGGENRPL